MYIGSAGALWLFNVINHLFITGACWGSLRRQVFTNTYGYELICSQYSRLYPRGVMASARVVPYIPAHGL